MGSGMTRRASIRDVAAAAGVSIATVSKVLRGDPTVTRDYSAKVRAAVAKLDYRIDPLAANLRRGQRTLIGVIAPDFENPFFGGVIAALEGVAEREGFALVAMSSWEDPAREAELIGRMRDWRVAGVVIAPTDDGTRAAALLKGFELEATLIDRAAPHPAFDTVRADDAAAAGAVADSLLDAGHRRILLVASAPDLPNIAARIDGFQARAAARGAQAAVAFCGLDKAAMGALLAAQIDALPQPTAIFSLYLPGLLATLAELRRRGWRRPRDVTLVSFDDADWMAFADPPIAAVGQPVRAMGLEAMRLLMARIRGEKAAPQACALPCAYDPRGAITPPGG